MLRSRLVLCYFLLIALVDAGQKFGGDGPFLNLDNVENLSTKIFFDKYVKMKKAVLIKNACKLFPAYNKWKSDKYLLQKASKFDDIKLTVETVKKETRNQNILA